MDPEPRESFETALGTTDINTNVKNEVVAVQETEDVKFTVANQSFGTAKKEKGIKGRRVSGFAIRTKAKTVDVLHLRPPRKLNHVSKVPEEEKTPEYYEFRRKNTEAARRCRENKRLLDEKRVEIIQRQRARIEDLEKKEVELQHVNQIYRGIIRNLVNDRRQLLLSPRGRGTRNGRGWDFK